MKMRDYENLEEMLCNELEGITKKGTITRNELDTVQKLLSAIEKTETIMMFAEQSESSERNSRRGDSYQNDSYRGGNNRGSYRDDSYDSYDNNRNSMANRTGTHYVRAHYSRAKGELSQEIERMMDEGNMSQDEEKTLMRAMEILGK